LPAKPLVLLVEPTGIEPVTSTMPLFDLRADAADFSIYGQDVRGMIRWDRIQRLLRASPPKRPDRHLAVCPSRLTDRRYRGSCGPQRLPEDEERPAVSNRKRGEGVSQIVHVKIRHSISWSAGAMP
jgi:hypothetical protein